MVRLRGGMDESDGGGGSYISHLPHFRSPTLKEDRVLSTWHQETRRTRAHARPPPPPPPHACVYQQAPVHQHRTVLEPLSHRTPPSPWPNKCQEATRTEPEQSVDAQRWRRGVGAARTGGGTHARIVAAVSLDAYPLCPGNNETRDQRRRRISVEISEGQRSRERPTGPDLQPELAGHPGR